MSVLQLAFSRDHGIELNETSFTLYAGSKPQHAIRGRTSGAYTGYGTFQWSQAVRALSALFLKYAAAGLRGDSSEGKLAGAHGSLAASLDYAIDKGPLWLADMFGVDSQGRLLARRAFLRTNPGRKRTGPVVIAVNGNFVAAQSIQIILEGTLVKDPNKIELLAREMDGEDACL